MRISNQSSNKADALFRGKSLKAVPTTAKKKLTTKGGDAVIIDIRRDKNLQTLVNGILHDFKHHNRTPMPLNLKPMLASIIQEPFNDPEWLFEIKWDGYRALSYLEKNKISIRSRNNNSFDQKFFPVHEALKQWPVNAVVDGEIVVLDEDGKPNFDKLQQWHRTGEGHLFYYVFDLLWLDGIDLTLQPLHQRKSILKKIVPEGGLIRFSDSIEQYGKQFFEAAKGGNLEGIMAKKSNAIYQPGYRTADWCKIKIEERHEAIICGYTKNKNTGRLFSSLILGVPQKGGMEFIGQVGTGFTTAMQRDIFKKMNPLFTTVCPFKTIPDTGGDTFWIKPHLVCEVKYTERTKEGLMRHPSFQGLREDKTIKDFN
ncbi:MAG: non-homologous end-joining DNA ligase [Bacteroidota bacterium]|nr:non-homologous end-joining DNA ligase [Bacteroidota bacterium]